MEINATSGLLSIIEFINTDISIHQEDHQHDGIQNSPDEQPSGAEDGETKPTEVAAHPAENIEDSSLQEEHHHDGEGARHPLNKPKSRTPPVGDYHDQDVPLAQDEDNTIHKENIAEGWTE